LRSLDVAFCTKGTASRRTKAVAAHWFRKAADGGCTGAQIMLGSMHESGDGVPLDLNVVKQLYTRAAARGDEVASFLLDRIRTREVQLRLGQQQAQARGGLSDWGLACLVAPPDPVNMEYEPNGDDDDASSDDEGGESDYESAESLDDTGGDVGLDCDDEDGTDLYGGPGGWPGDF
jgi:TPR repeat protein